MIFVVYSVISPTSFANVPVWAAELARECPGKPLILLGNKTDQRDDAELRGRLAAKGLEPVKLVEGQRAAESMGALAFYETSCNPGATSDPLERVFREGVQLVFGNGNAAAAAAGRRKKGARAQNCVLM